MSAATRARLLEETRQAFRRHAEMKGRVEGESTRPPEPGDVFALDLPGDFVVEWVVLARGPADSGRVLAVPADGNPLAGSADVERSNSASSGSLILRCRLACWLDAGAPDAAARVGVLGPGDVDRARRRCSEIEDGTFTGSVLAREVDEDPEYQDWVDKVLMPARHALLGKVGEAEDDVGETGILRPQRGPRRPHSDLRLLSLIAASILLVVAGSLAGGLLWRQQKRIQTLETAGEIAEREHRREIRRLEAERDGMEAEHRRELGKAGEEAARVEEEYRERLAELDRRLEKARRESAVLNPVIALLEPAAEIRGKMQTLRLPPRASHVVLFVTLRDSSPALEHRIELLEKETGKKVWANSDLTWEEPGELRAGLPASLLAPGEYRLRVLSLESGRLRPLAEHTLRIEHE